ncbi:MAG: nucleotidyltransferase family protein [Proteobacteria bacterium]|nr:nucleotidyltransferase family protein [Pseudomonadota bacterium]
MQEQTDLIQIIQLLRQHLPLLAEKYQVESFSVFGSYVRHEQRSDSDLDVLVTFHEQPSLLKFIELENYLSDVMGVKIDLVMRNALKPRIGRRILSEAVAV